MKSSFVFGFILIILLIIGVFVGLPYAIQKLRSGISSLSLPIPKIYMKPQTFAPVLPANKQGGHATGPAIKIGESLYKGKVVISAFSSSGVSLSASRFSTGAVDVTGWRIKSAERGETVIGQGINLPQFEVIPSDIWLKSGNSLNIIIGPSPLGGNFRANNCFGWLNNLYNFSYSLNYCPGGFKLSDLSGLDNVCKDLILRSGYCQKISDNVLNKQSGSCRIWAEKNMNYNACVANHRNDNNFYKEWKVYTGNGNQIFDPRHDRIELRDQAGLLVDGYEY